MHGRTPLYASSPLLLCGATLGQGRKQGRRAHFKLTRPHAPQGRTASTIGEEKKFNPRLVRPPCQRTPRPLLSHGAARSATGTRAAPHAPPPLAPASPRPLQGSSKTPEDFVKIMADLKLLYPKQIDRALPANLQCAAP